MASIHKEREVLVDLDDDARRLVWSAVDGPYTHHNGAAQVHETGDGGTRFERRAARGARA